MCYRKKKAKIPLFQSFTVSEFFCDMKRTYVLKKNSQSIANKIWLI